jgi:SAM-dependent methyltransferase
MIYHKENTFEYFSKYITWNDTDHILNFGGNSGNLIRSSEGKIKQEHYTCVDVDMQAMTEGLAAFPNATWIHYNRFNPIYNIGGKNELPNLPRSYNLICSYSVFLHMSYRDTIEILNFLWKVLEPGGKIFFSWCNVDDERTVNLFKDWNKIEDDLPEVDDYLYLVDNKVQLVGPFYPKRTFVCMYKKDFLLKALSKFNPVSHLPPRNWFQECMELTKL